MTEINITLQGSVVVACRHNVDKRKVLDLVYDIRREKISQCLCCENLFAYDINDQGIAPPPLCDKCRG